MDDHPGNFSTETGADRRLTRVKAPPSLAKFLPPEPGPETAMPGFSWEELERQLEDLTDSAEKVRMVGPLVSGLRKQARFKPAELVLREVLCLAWTLMDEAFQPGLGPGEEAEMP